ncbi:hypothetical protein EYR40_005370 [Pleurotus pulmonarius]|nr:hypothetical protein EYR40_005370 [Pleurotus pulmonarius]
MDTITEGVLHKRAPFMGDDPEKSSEKGTSEKIEVTSVEVDNADEALRLVGTERAQSFSEEYNRKLRRKLVNYPVCSVMNARGLMGQEFPQLCKGISFYSGNILAPYQIVYIVLGGLAIVVGISILIWLPDSPIHARMLTAEERIAALERVRDDQGGTENKTIKRDQVIEALLDIRTWLIVLTVMLTSVPNGGISNWIYIATCFGSALSTIYAYNASNTSGHTKKSTINALTMVTFALGNIIGTEIFPPKDAPDYIPGKIAVMTLIVIQLGLSFIIRWINLRLNKQKRAKIAELKERYGWTEADVEKERERHAFLDLTDKQNPFFVYTA